MRHVPARPEQMQSLFAVDHTVRVTWTDRVHVRAICIHTLRAATLASSGRDALDVCGDALRQLAELARAEAEHD